MKLFKKNGDQLEIGKWYVGYRDKNLELTYRNRGYHYNNAEIHISMFGWHSMFRLPWRHKSNEWYREEKRYGFYTFNKTLFSCWGWMLKSWEFPFVNYGTAIRWERYKGDPETYLISSLEKENWEQHPYKTEYDGGCQQPTIWEYNFTDAYDGEVISCKYWVEEMEWRPKWLQWTKNFSKTRRFIEVEFSKEVGSGKGTWKGGTTGLSYDLLPDEHPIACIQRMEKEYQIKGLK